MSETIGHKLSDARMARNLSLEEAAEETHIRIHYLEALEKGDLDQLPSQAHARGFLRAYSGYLGLNPESVVDLLDEGSDPVQVIDEMVSDDPDVQEPVSSGDSILIFQQLGEKLRQQREILGFSLEEIERNIHIRQHYLEAIEDGKMDDLPSPVQGRGMLQNYAEFLGMDEEQVLLQFADGLQAQLAERKSVRKVPADTKPSRRRVSLPLRRFFPGDWILGTSLIVVLIVFVVWGSIRINSLRAAQIPVETVPSIADALQATPDEMISEAVIPTDTPLPEIVETNPAGGAAEIPAEQLTEQAAPETPVPTISDAPVQVYVSVLQRAWMRVNVDGEVEFEGRVIPGGAYAFSGEFEITLLTGNGAALQVFFNETDLGVLGVYGEVVLRVFTSEGVLLPTATITPQPTNTPLATPTSQFTTSP
jgi:cytoskeletal protein RodZ